MALTVTFVGQELSWPLASLLSLFVLSFPPSECGQLTLSQTRGVVAKPFLPHGVQ